MPFNMNMSDTYIYQGVSQKLHTKAVQRSSSVFNTHWSAELVSPYMSQEFSVPQIVYPLGVSSKKGDHVYVLLVGVIVTSGHHGSIRTIFISNNSITQKTCNRKYTWVPFLLLLVVGILFEVLRIR